MSMYRKSMSVLLFALLLGGTTLFMGCSKTEKTVVGAVLGAGVGAGIGAAAGGTGGAVAGGAIGGVTGGVVGHSLGDDEKAEKDK